MLATLLQSSWIEAGSTPFIIVAPSFLGPADDVCCLLLSGGYFTLSLLDLLVIGPTEIWQ